MKKIFSILLVAALVITGTIGATGMSVSAADFGIGLSEDFSMTYYSRDAQVFVDILEEELNWSTAFATEYALRGLWKEETFNGFDNMGADNCKLALEMAHGDATGSVTEIIFTDSNLDDPADSVRLGYLSPDNYGFNIWSFFISCSLFKDTSYPSWSNALQGTHMMLGFASSAVWGASSEWGDLQELADRFLGLEGEEDFDKQNIQHSFWDTYVSDDGFRGNNIGRILAEDDDVIDDDWIDSYDTQIAHDQYYIILTYSV